MKKIIIFALVALSVSSAAFASSKSEINGFVKAGYSSWNESIESRSDLLSENGVSIEPGVAYISHAVPYVALEGNVSVKAVGSVYTGAADTSGTGYIVSGRANVSPKAELKATGEIPVTETFSIGPVVGAQFEELFRPFASERWEIATAKIGVKTVYKKLQVEIGATKPVYTVNHYSSAEGNYRVNPKGAVSPYAEIKYVFESGKVLHVFYEESKWNQSDAISRVQTFHTATGGTYSTVSQIFQPESTSRTIGLKFEWVF